MHSYLRSIGFLKANRIDEVNLILENTAEAYDEKHIYETKNGRCLGEIIKYYADSIGIKIVGEYDRNHHFHREYYLPFILGEQISTSEDVIIEKRLNQDAFYVICDDVRLGSTLIFSLQNMNEYIQQKRDENPVAGAKSVILTGLAHNGTILFPVENSEKTETEKKAVQDHRSLMRAAQGGDRDAMESLTLEEFDTYSMIADRIEREDVLTIVDSYFIPSGIEADEYNILGTIKDCFVTGNALTGEEIVVMQIEVNDISLKVCVNREDLMGEPEAGRRFKGSIWLQGQVFF